MGLKHCNESCPKLSMPLTGLRCLWFGHIPYLSSLGLRAAFEIPGAPACRAKLLGDGTMSYGFHRVGSKRKRKRLRSSGVSLI